MKDPRWTLAMSSDKCYVYEGSYRRFQIEADSDKETKIDGDRHRVKERVGERRIRRE